MNTAVSFELAKLLKEKGFKEPVKTAYLFNSEIANVPDGEFSNKGEKYISAPTIAEVVMWLYEKHSIWIYIRQVRNPEPLLNYWCGIINKDAKLIDSVEGYNSPTEAYEATIEHTLKNIIKQKQ